MHVFHDLPGGLAVVLQEVVAGGAGDGEEGLGELRQEFGDAGERFGGHLVEGGVVVTRDEEGVAFGQGGDVEEGDGVR